jgi:hypothetical protein
MSGQPKPSDTEAFRFTLGSREHRLSLHLTRPQINAANLKLAATTLPSTLLLQHQIVVAHQYLQQGFVFKPHTAALELRVPDWKDKELPTVIMARLCRRPATLPELRVALFMSAPGSDEWLGHVLYTMIQKRHIAFFSPGRYFALPWKRFGILYTPKAFGLTGYLSLASEFWKSQDVQPTVKQEPDEIVRDIVSKHVALMKADGRPPKPRVQPVVRYATPLLRRQVDLSPDAQAARQELLARQIQVAQRLISLRAANPWLVIPAGTQYISVLGTHFRIDPSLLPEGKLWMYWRSDGQQISAAVKAGQVFTKIAKEGWTALRSQAELTRHFHEARLARNAGYLQAYALGEEVLQALPMY